MQEKGLSAVALHESLFEKAIIDKWQKQQQQAVKRWQTGGKAGHIAVVAVATVNFDTWGSVALTVCLTAERLVGARLHHPT